MKIEKKRLEKIIINKLKVTFEEKNKIQEKK